MLKCSTCFDVFDYFFVVFDRFLMCLTLVGLFLTRCWSFKHVFIVLKTFWSLCMFVNVCFATCFDLFNTFQSFCNVLIVLKHFLTCLIRFDVFTFLHFLFDLFVYVFYLFTYLIHVLHLLRFLNVFLQFVCRLLYFLFFVVICF